MPCDICDATSWPQWLPSHASADLYTLVFFLSEVFSQQTIAEPYLNALLDAADEGTYLLYVDNRSWQFYRWMEKLLGGHAYQVIGGASCDMRLPVEEEKLALGDYLGKFGSPKLKSNVAWRVAVKG